MCCGNKRAAVAAPPLPPARNAPSAHAVGGVHPPAHAVPSAATIVFEAVDGPLTATGPASGRRYRFAARGERHAVDPRDRPGLAALRGLRQV